MKPIRLNKDRVLHTVHTAADRFRIVSGAQAAQTLANPNGHGWPTCWKCTERRMEEQKSRIASGRFGEATFVAVEAYDIVDARENEEDLRATCTHGNPGGRAYTETLTLSMPKTWSENKKAIKRASLMFFVESSALPVGGNVVLL